MKKLISILLILTMLFTVPVMAYAEETIGETEEEYTVELGDDGLPNVPSHVITKVEGERIKLPDGFESGDKLIIEGDELDYYDIMYLKNIPEEHYIYDTVTTRIEESTLGYNQKCLGANFTKLTYIGNSAFYMQKNLKYFVFNDDIEYIGERAFYYCFEFAEEVILPKKLKIIEESAFEGCKTTNKVVFGDEIEEIGKRAFVSCSLEEVIIPKSIKVIRERTFSCSSLKKVVLHEDIEKIEMYGLYKDFDEGFKVAYFMNNAKPELAESRPFTDNPIIFVENDKVDEYKDYFATAYPKYKNLVKPMTQHTDVIKTLGGYFSDISFERLDGYWTHNDEVIQDLNNNRITMYSLDFNNSGHYKFYVLGEDEAWCSYNLEIVKKTNNDTPYRPYRFDKTETSIEFDISEGHEFSINGGETWQDEGFFSELTPRTSYIITSRIKETETHFASKEIDTVPIWTMYHPEKPRVPVVKNKTINKIEIETEEGIEYSINGGKYWEKNGVFNFLSYGTEYEIVSIMKATQNNYESEISDPLIVKTKNPSGKPSSPVLASKTYNEITLVEIEGQEYCIDKGDWQDSGVFTDLEPKTVYCFLTRVKETDEVQQSSSSYSTYISTMYDAEKPTPPYLQSVDDITIDIYQYGDVEFTIDNGETWFRTSKLENLTPDTEYSICSRIREKENAYYASEMSDPLVVRTKKTQLEMPTSPTVIDVSDSSIELKGNKELEYSIWGNGYWQSEAVFLYLESDKEYEISYRLRANETFAASKSKTIIVKTEIAGEEVSNLVVKTRTNDTISFKRINECQYAMKIADGEYINWQSSSVFSGLEELTEYVFVAGWGYNRTQSEEYDIRDEITVKTRGIPKEKVKTPTLKEKSDNHIVLSTFEGYEYSIDGGISWQDDTEFANLEKGETYSFVARIKETEDYIASDISSVFKVKTGKEIKPSPEVPVEVQPNIELLRKDRIAYVFGTTDTLVKPEQSITRAEFCSMIYRLLKPEIIENTDSVNRFVDVPDGAWYAEAVNTLASLELIFGYGDSVFKPSQHITRAEIAEIMSKFTLDTDKSVEITFEDISGHWAESSIKKVYSLGWVKGYDEFRYLPNKQLTRAEAVAIINRALERSFTESELNNDTIHFEDNLSSKWYYYDVLEATNTCV